MIFLPTALLSKRPSRSLLALKVFITRFRILAASVLTQFRRGHRFLGDSVSAYFFTRQSVHARAHVAQFQKPAAHGCFRSSVLSPLPIFVGPSSCVRHQVARVRVDCWIFFVVILAASSHPDAVIFAASSCPMFDFSPVIFPSLAVRQLRSRRAPRHAQLGSPPLCWL
jgi:hypothetical protein